MRKPRAHHNAELRWNSDNGWKYIMLRPSPGSWQYDLLTAHQARQFAQRLIAMADWLDAQKADRQAGGGGDRG